MYSSHDLHAWPEMYFGGVGWVRFEPTPAHRAGGVPAYTTQQVPVGNPTGGAATGLPRDQRAPTRTAGPAGTREAPVPEAPAGRAGAPASRWPLFGGAVGAGLVGALLLLPRGLRRRRRERRLAGGPEDAWDELRATAIDLGVPWPDRRSPRETATALVAHFGAPVDENTAPRPARGPDVAPDAGACPGPAGPRAGAGALRPGRWPVRRAPAARARRDRDLPRGAVRRRAAQRPAARRLVAALGGVPHAEPPGRRGPAGGLRAVRRRGRPRALRENADRAL